MRGGRRWGRITGAVVGGVIGAIMVRELGYVASGTWLMPDADTILLKVTRINGGRLDVPREYPAHVVELTANRLCLRTRYEVVSGCFTRTGS